MAGRNQEFPQKNSTLIFNLFYINRFKNFSIDNGELLGTQDKELRTEN